MASRVLASWVHDYDDACMHVRRHPATFEMPAPAQPARGSSQTDAPPQHPRSWPWAGSPSSSRCRRRRAATGKGRDRLRRYSRHPCADAKGRAWISPTDQMDCGFLESKSNWSHQTPTTHLRVVSLSPLGPSDMAVRLAAAVERGKCEGSTYAPPPGAMTRIPIATMQHHLLPASSILCRPSLSCSPKIGDCCQWPWSFKGSLVQKTRGFPA